jgi:allophanate hydrolase subunit 1
MREKLRWSSNSAIPSIPRSTIACSLDAALRADPPAGTCEFVPTYRSLMIHYHPLEIDRETLIGIVHRAMESVTEGRGQAAAWTLPCCYDLELAEELDEAAGILGLTRDAAIALQAKARYRVYMCGFTPGQPYLGGVPETIRSGGPRSPLCPCTPRRHRPAMLASLSFALVARLTFEGGPEVNSSKFLPRAQKVARLPVK